MKIREVKLTSFRPPLPDGFQVPTLYGGQSIGAYVSDFLAVQIITDEGLSGEVVSAYGGLSLAHSIADRLRPMLIGRDPAARDAPRPWPGASGRRFGQSPKGRRIGRSARAR